MYNSYLKANAIVSERKPSLHEFSPVNYKRMSSDTTALYNSQSLGCNEDCHVELLLCCVLFTVSCVQGTDDSVRSCFIKFALSFLVIGGDHVIRAILELKGM